MLDYCQCCIFLAPALGSITFLQVLSIILSALKKMGQLPLQVKVNTTEAHKVWFISLLSKSLILGQLSVSRIAKCIAWRTVTSRSIQQKSFAGDRQPTGVPINSSEKNLHRKYSVETYNKCNDPPPRKTHGGKLD